MTRPGVAAIASALLVEIFVSLLQHPLGGSAPAPLSAAEDRGDHPLGIVPHQIRGYLSNFQNLVIKGSSYHCCSACSQRITGAYKSDGWQFLKRALTETGYVEELSGLAEVKDYTNNCTMLEILIAFARCNVQLSKLSPRSRSVTIAT